MKITIVILTFTLFINCKKGRKEFSSKIAKYKSNKTNADTTGAGADTTGAGADRTGAGADTTGAGADTTNNKKEKTFVVTWGSSDYGGNSSTEELFPPLSMLPQVTTEPFSFNAAKAPPVEKIFATPELS